MRSGDPEFEAFFGELNLAAGIQVAIEFFVCGEFKANGAVLVPELFCRNFTGIAAGRTIAMLGP